VLPDCCAIWINLARHQREEMTDITWHAVRLVYSWSTDNSDERGKKYHDSLYSQVRKIFHTLPQCPQRLRERSHQHRSSLCDWRFGHRENRDQSISAWRKRILGFGMIEGIAWRPLEGHREHFFPLLCCEHSLDWVSKACRTRGKESEGGSEHCTIHVDKRSFPQNLSMLHFVGDECRCKECWAIFVHQMTLPHHCRFPFDWRIRWDGGQGRRRKKVRKKKKRTNQRGKGAGGHTTRLVESAIPVIVIARWFEEVGPPAQERCILWDLAVGEVIHGVTLLIFHTKFRTQFTAINGGQFTAIKSGQLMQF